MKAFTYERVHSVAEAVAAMARTPDAQFIAGGTNLLDLMKLHTGPRFLRICVGCGRLHRAAGR
jgi:CO/xanthine dehydrogenase FAD-binding subunit